MNIVLQFLQENRNRLGLEYLGSESRLSCFLTTPKFRASSHVIFFIFNDGASKPILIAKVPRLAGETNSLDREAANLREISVYRPDGLNSVPRVVAYEDFRDNRMLVETALNGQAMTSALVRRRSKEFVDTVLSWLIEFHTSTNESSSSCPDWFNRLAIRPWKQFLKAMPLTDEEYRLMDTTRNLSDVLKHEEIGLVFEHQDLGHPNILLRQDGTIGVVDWELAEPRGLPAVDLFFLLTLVSFAKRGAKNNQDYLAAFREAFFGRNAWAKSYVKRYAERLDLPHETLKPLFILCWSRYLNNITKRLTWCGNTEEVLCDETVAWLRANRYYALWRYAVNHVDELNLTD